MPTVSRNEGGARAQGNHGFGIAWIDPETLPRLAELGPRWAALSATDTYADGLRALVDGLLDRR
ncbi:hypothetical protein APR12_002873 [Nocardia amikacinitolerans]|uniref:hypothetical protein n=1 Tax=Nocardia amikacinitolerans TaxID=756689 RepID=UPI00082A0C65|nr:hypothetical protein [Nocardia amikacinitolerans]MCP2317527.1 hypothetical protein [Nocardia amikacinitolerans]